MRHCLRLLYNLESTLGIKSAESLVVGFGYDRHGMVANHAIVLLSPQAPYRQETLHLSLLDERIDHAVHAVGHYDGVEWMGCTVSVPTRESGVELTGLRLHQLVVGVAIHAVHVSNLVGLDQSVIERGVVVLLLLLGSLNVDALQIIVPVVVCRSLYGSEVPSRHLGLEVLLGTFGR